MVNDVKSDWNYGSDIVLFDISIVLILLQIW